MDWVPSESPISDQMRDVAFEQVRGDPTSFLFLDDEFKSDPDICLASLLAYRTNDDEDQLFPSMIEMMFHYLPDFTEHKQVLCKFMELGDDQSMEVYLERFAPRFIHDEDFVKQIVEVNLFTPFYKCLPDTLKSDPGLLRVAITSLSDEALPAFLHAIPSRALAEQTFILSHAVDRPEIHFQHVLIPPSRWCDRDFVLKWSDKGKLLVSIGSIPVEWKEDRQMCLSLYRSQTDRTDFDVVVRWISATFLADRDFVLECSTHHPKIFEFCSKEIQEDFDVRLNAAFAGIGKKLFLRFADKIGESIVPFAQMVHREIEAQDDFLEQLACHLKSRWNAVELSCCEEGTVRELAKEIATFLGFSDLDRLVRLKSVWDEIVPLVIARETMSELVPLVQLNGLVQGVLRAIESKSCVALKSFPIELWKNLFFVMWAAKNGIFHDAIPDEFSEDLDICFAYYKHSPAVREMTWPWISNKLKSNRDFVLACTSIDPLVLTHIHNDEVRSDFKLLLNAFHNAAQNAQLNGLIDVARRGGWSSLIEAFAKSVLAKVVVQHGFNNFELEVGARGLFQVSTERKLLKLIGAYCGAITDSTELGQLNVVWSYHSIHFLALGGSVKVLCHANQFRSERQMADDDKDGDDVDEDDDEDDDDDNSDDEDD